MNETIQEWKERMLRKLDISEKSDMDNLERQIENMHDAHDYARQLLDAFREPPGFLFVHQNSIYISTNNFLLAHDVAKNLRTKLDKSLQADGLNYRAKVDGVEIWIYGMSTIPKCTLKKRTVLVPKVVWEMKC